MENLPEDQPEHEFLESPEIYRAGGDVICPECEQTKKSHPFEEEVLSYDDLPYLRRLCNGDLVKL